MSGFQIFDDGIVVASFEQRIRIFSTIPVMKKSLDPGDYVLFAEIAEDHPNYHVKLQISLTRMDGTPDGTEEVSWQEVTGRKKTVHQFTLSTPGEFRCKVTAESVFHHTPLKIGLVRVRDMDVCSADIIFDSFRLQRYVQKHSANDTITTFELTPTSEYLLNPDDRRSREAMWSRLRDAESVDDDVPKLTLLQCAAYAHEVPAIDLLCAYGADVMAPTPKRQMHSMSLFRETAGSSIPMPMSFVNAVQAGRRGGHRHQQPTISLGGDLSSLNAVLNSAIANRRAGGPPTVIQLNNLNDMNNADSLESLLTAAMNAAENARQIQATGINTNVGAAATPPGVILPYRTYRAAYDYARQGPSELTVKAGQLLRTLEGASTDGWIKCETVPGGAMGFVPLWNLGPVILPPSQAAVPVPAAAMAPPAPKAQPRSQNIKTTIPKATRPGANEVFKDVQFRVLADFSARGPGELSVNRGEIVFGLQPPTEDGWLKVRVSRPNRTGTAGANGINYGFVPYSYLRKNTEVVPLEPEASAPPMMVPLNGGDDQMANVFSMGGSNQKAEVVSLNETAFGGMGMEAATARVATSKDSEQAQPAECPICFEDMHAQPVAVFQDLFGRKRTCRHFLHLRCAEEVVRTTPGRTQCPICRVRFEQVRPVPDFDTSPQEWFDLMDYEKNGSLSKQEVMDAFKALLTIDYQALERDVDRLWPQWTGGVNKEITFEQLCNPHGGLLVYVRRRFALLDFKEACPSLKENPIKWFEYFDEDSHGELSKGEVLRGLIKSYGVASDTQSLEQVRRALDDIWPVFCGTSEASCDQEQFVRVGGLADALIASFESGAMMGSGNPLTAMPEDDMAAFGRRLLREANE